MSHIVEIWITGSQATLDHVSHKLSDLFDVVEESDHAGDNGLARRIIKIEAHSSRINRIEVVIEGDLGLQRENITV
jgi:hypothetical protein